MLKHVKFFRTLIAIVLTLALLATFLFLPVFMQLVSVLMLLVSIGMTISFTAQKHWQSYQQAECTREKMIRNLALDILGMFLTLGAAMYAGRLAGTYFGLRVGFWLGILAGFIGGFLAAWAVRSVWGRIVRVA